MMESTSLEASSLTFIEMAPLTSGVGPGGPEWTTPLGLPLQSVALLSYRFAVKCLSITPERTREAGLCAP